MTKNQDLQDEVTITEKVTEDLIIQVKTQLLDEPESIVILTHETIINKNFPHLSTTEKIYRKEIKK